MSRGNEARAALKAECEAAIEDIKRNGHLSNCKAHDALARGQITLLRCEVARLESDDRKHGLTKIWSAIIALIVTVLVSWIQWRFWGK